MGIKPNLHQKINKYIGVSKVVCDGFKEITGVEAELIYNPIEVEKPKKVLNLISATRLTPDKGKNRMIKLAQLLDNAEIPYIWTIFTNDTKVIDNPNIVYMKPRLDISNYIANADYLVQLSNAEGYCYSIVESLSLRTPVIVTDMPVVHEIGVNKDNGFILNFELSNVDVEQIYNKQFNFTYIPKNDNWKKILIKKENNYMAEKMYKVEALDTYQNTGKKDGQLGRIPKLGEQWEVDEERLKTLTGENSKGLVFVKLVEEPKKEVKKKKKLGIA